MNPDGGVGRERADLRLVSTVERPATLWRPSSSAAARPACRAFCAHALVMAPRLLALRARANSRQTSRRHRPFEVPQVMGRTRPQYSVFHSRSAVERKPGLVAGIGVYGRRSRPDMRVAVAYLRVSTSEQHLGPEAQRAAIEAWAARENITVVAWHTDHGVSGRSDIDDRPD